MDVPGGGGRGGGIRVGKGERGGVPWCPCVRRVWESLGETLVGSEDSPEEQRKQWGVTDLQFMSTLFLSRESFTFTQRSAWFWSSTLAQAEIFQQLLDGFWIIFIGFFFVFVFYKYKLWSQYLYDPLTSGHIIWSNFNLSSTLGHDQIPAKLMAILSASAVHSATLAFCSMYHTA